MNNLEIEIERLKLVVDTLCKEEIAVALDYEGYYNEAEIIRQEINAKKI